jgi:hypothetical protein
LKRSGRERKLKAKAPSPEGEEEPLEATCSDEI